MQKQTEVLVVCPDCAREYIQSVTGEYIGPRRRAPNYKRALRERCCAHGQVKDERSWYGLMLCAECSLRRCPPALRPALQRWLEHGEVREGDCPPV